MQAVVRAWATRLREGTHPEQYPHLSGEAVRWVLRHHAWGPGYLIRYARLLRLRLLHPDVVTHGMVFLGRGVRVETTPGYGRLHLGAFVHLGDRCVLRAHEGTLRVRDKVVMGSDVRVTCWLDVDLGEATLLADWCYVADFDHVHDDVARPVKDQGIRKGRCGSAPGRGSGCAAACCGAPTSAAARSSRRTPWSRAASATTWCSPGCRRSSSRTGPRGPAEVPGTHLDSHPADVPDAGCGGSAAARATDR